jgi:ribosomal protein S18 acetylase RimI-like enzyme
MELRWMTPVDADATAVSAASHLFDHEVRLEWVQQFLAQPDHHLCIAYASGSEPTGFVSGVELTHPDKGSEMFLYELGVDDRFRGHGIGKALVAALIDLARERACYGVWVLTDSDNSAAVRTYKSAGISNTSEHLMLSCNLDHAPQSSTDDPAKA